MVTSVNWPDRVTLCEVGLRDGIQNERCLTVEQKLALLESVTHSGLRIVEIGAFVHPKAVPQMADTGDLARRMPRLPGVEYRVLVPNLKGLERALDAGLTKAKLTVSVSESHCLNNFNRTPLAMMDGFTACAEFAAREGLELSGALSSAFGCAFDGCIPLERVKTLVRRFVDLGIRELSLSDTTGMANPRQVYETGLRVHEAFPEVCWVLHLHNTRGMAMACVTAALQAGFRVFDGAFGGFGGCPYVPGASGNLATEDVAHMLGEMGIETGVDVVRAMDTARMAATLLEKNADSAVLRGGRCCDLSSEQAKRQDNA